MTKVLIVRAAVPLPDDVFVSASIISTIKPAIDAFQQVLGEIKGIDVSITIGGRGGRGAAAKNGVAPVTRRKRRSAEEIATAAEDTMAAAAQAGLLPK